MNGGGKKMNKMSQRMKNNDAQDKNILDSNWLNKKERKKERKASMEFFSFLSPHEKLSFCRAANYKWQSAVPFVS